MKIVWEQIREEAIHCLGEYVRIDTTNPPGNEGLAVEFLKGKLEAEGLEVQTLATDPQRPNLVCRLKGDGSKRPIILLHHMDVVPVERDKWSVDPFSGEVKDGFLWGRGALDVKGLGIMELMAFLLAHRRSLPLKRDLIYVAAADEETGGKVGARWLADNHAQDLEAEYLINEGGVGWRRGDRSGFSLAVGEKGPLWLRLFTEGPAGHGATPLPNSAVLRIVRALNRIGEYKSPIRIVDEMKPFLQKVGIDPEITPEELAAHELMETPHIAAMFANTISLTLLHAGEKVNVIPSQAEAALDCRLLPGTTVEGFLRELRAIIDDERVRISASNSFQPSASPVGTEMYRALEESLNEHYPDVPVLPTISVGFTDSRCFRKLGTHCYGILPFISDGEVLTTIHGHDERIPLESLEKGTRVLCGVVERLNT